MLQRSAVNIFVNSQLASSRLVPVTCMLQLGSSPTENTQSISRSENAAEGNYLMPYAVFKNVIFKQGLSRHFPEFMCENGFCIETEYFGVYLIKWITAQQPLFTGQIEESELFITEIILL